jgi:3-deoxy-D-manno-octulosonic-acid transferase
MKDDACNELPMPRLLILLLYNLLYPLALLVMAPAALRKMKARGGKWSDLRQRLGFFERKLAREIAGLTSRRRSWWVHAVSVGEIGIAAKLIRELSRQDDAPGIILSTTTPTGFAEGQKIAAEFPGRVCVIYNPLDLWFTVRRCLRLIAPERLVLVEAEVWPNLVFAAWRRGIAVSLVNARLSPRSEQRYARALPLVRPVFSMLSQVFVQEPEDVDRWARLGVARDRIRHVGSIKYDIAGQSEPLGQIAQFGTLLKNAGWNAGDPVVLAASTHAGEEVAIAEIVSRLRSSIDRIRLILVPRHAERAAQIESQLRDAGLGVVRRSSLGGGAAASDVAPAGSIGEPPGVLLVDTTGELRAWQHHATVVVMGKSFIGTGGQNPAEAVAAGKPVLFGPHMENFAPLVRGLLAAGGAVQVADFAELEGRLAELLRDAALAARLAAAGAGALRGHEGAAARTVDALLHFPGK